MFSLLKESYKKLKGFFGSKLASIFKGPFTEETIEQLEELLYTCDLGSKLTHYFIEKVKEEHKKNAKATVDDYIKTMKQAALALFPPTLPTQSILKKPHLILIVGINGSGKTTTIARLAKRFKSEGKKLLIAAGDTFRAAAVHQLKIWADRIDVEVVEGQSKNQYKDPSGVIYEAFQRGQSQDSDIILADTAGRLESKEDLMRELEKIARSVKKLDSTAPHETLLVIDATSGQNGIQQAKAFHKVLPIDGIVLTKLDGTAKGGIALAIYDELNIPIRWVGIGEGADDLQSFDPKLYVEALFR